MTGTDVTGPDTHLVILDGGRSTTTPLIPDALRARAGQ